MRRQYQWRTASEIISGGYPGEEYGVLGGTPDWQTTDVMSGSTTAQYYFRDSYTSDNNNSSRVVVTITESWTAEIDQQNYLTVKLTTTVDSIVRDSIRGNPGNVLRNMYIRREAGGQVLWSATNDSIATAHTIMGTPLALGEYQFTLTPGEYTSRGSIYFTNLVPGHESDPLPSRYVDEMWLGTNFLNPLPKDYRPGATLKADNEYGPAENIIWVSNNDKNSGCHILSDVDNMTWKEMRTRAGRDKAPSILTADDDPDSWYNQQELGKYLRT